MTYQEIVNRIQTIVDAHYQLADFGYGDLSDLKTRFENTSGDSAVQADYPYLFLNPGVHNRNLTTMTYNFNMIVMDMARGEVSDQPYNNILAIQSQCQQMIDDVLANLYYGFQDQPEVMRTNVTYTPFNERFQDDVAGMTASLSIEVPTGLNNCITPIRNFEQVATIPINIGPNIGYNYWNIADQWPIPEPFTTYKIVWDFTLVNQTTPIVPNGPEPYNVPYFTIAQDADNPRWLVQEPFDGTITTEQRIMGEYTLALQDLPPDDNDLFFGLGFFPNGEYPGTTVTPEEILNVFQLFSGSIKIYKQA